MHTRLPILYFLLAVYCLGSLGCEDDDIVIPTNCPYSFTTIPASSSQECDPFGAELIDLNTAPAAPQPPYLRNDCGLFTDLARTIQVTPPSDDDLDLIVYCGASGNALVQVYGATDCDNNLTPLTACREIPLVETIPVTGVSNYTKLFVRVELLATPGLPVDQTDYIKVVAYDELPQLTQVGYHGTLTTSNGEIEVSCDGSSFQRVVISTCDADTDVPAFITSLGLVVDEEHTFRDDDGTMGAVRAVIYPNGSGGNPTQVTRAVTVKKVDVNGDIGADPDLLLGVTGLFQYRGDNDGIIPECLEYQDRAPEAREGESLRITVIDTGVELDDAFPGGWDRHPYLGSDYARIQNGSLGWDYYYDQPLNDDPFGHGTAVASTVYGGYRSNRPLSMIHMNIFSNAGVGNYFTAVCAIHDAITIGSDLVNMSWGIPYDGELQGLDCALERGERQGVIMVTSAGNDDLDIGITPQYPAAYHGEANHPLLFTVGSFRASDFGGDYFKTNESNFSADKVTLMAFRAGYAWNPLEQGFQYLDGTSFSAPNLSRVISTMLGEGYDPYAIYPVLENSVLGISSNLGGRCVNQQYLPICTTGREVSP